MSLFVEVFSLEKDCPVILNLDEVLEIAPLKDGTTAIFFSDSAAVGGRTAVKVRDSYTLFKQFVVTPVTAEDIARRFPKSAPPTTVSVNEESKSVKEGRQVLEEKKSALKRGSQGPGTTTADLG